MLCKKEDKRRKWSALNGNLDYSAISLNAQQLNAISAQKKNQNNSIRIEQNCKSPFIKRVHAEMRIKRGKENTNGGQLQSTGRCSSIVGYNQTSTKDFL